MATAAIPPLAQYPKASWQKQLSSQEWSGLIQAWETLCGAYLSLSDDDFRKLSKNEGSVAAFASSFVHENGSNTSSTLNRLVFRLTSRLWKLGSSSDLSEWTFLANFARMYPKKLTAPPIGDLFSRQSTSSYIEASLTALKKQLIPHLESGIKGDLNLVETSLVAVNPLLHVSPHACSLLLAGSDFFDGLVTCFTVMNPPLRKAIIATIYLCVMGLTESEPPKWAMLSDQLFTLKSAADAHKQGPLNVNDSLIAELVTATPLLHTLLRRAEAMDAATDGLRKRLGSLEPFKKGPMARPKRLTRRKIDKGKGKATHGHVHTEMHVHRMSQITQVQDLFPDLGAGFVSKCLDECGDDVEQVVANLLAESLPSHLATADRSEPLYASLHSITHHVLQLTLI